MFCFAVLEAFDVEQLEALVSPRTIVRKQLSGASKP